MVALSLKGFSFLQIKINADGTSFITRHWGGEIRNKFVVKVLVVKGKNKKRAEAELRFLITPEGGATLQPVARWRSARLGRKLRYKPGPSTSTCPVCPVTLGTWHTKVSQPVSFLFSTLKVLVLSSTKVALPP